MIIKINGRIIEPASAPIPATALCNMTIIPQESCLNFLKMLNDFVKMFSGYAEKIIPPGAMFAVMPVTGGGLITKLWPLVDKLQEFGLIAGIGMSLWGLCIIILGDPSGKSKIWQAVVGFVGLFILPEVFFAIYQAFKGGS